jgi:hypothetical protein
MKTGSSIDSSVPKRTSTLSFQPVAFLSGHRLYRLYWALPVVDALLDGVVPELGHFSSRVPALEVEERAQDGAHVKQRVAHSSANLQEEIIKKSLCHHHDVLRSCQCEME